MAPRTKKKDYLWIYNDGNCKSNMYEFHKDLQEHIENSYKRKKKTCKVSIFGVTHTIDFEKMLKYRNRPNTSEVKRITRSQAKQYGVLGCAGVPYMKKEGFQQDHDICYICYYKLTIPTRIENCGHEFCYVCLKSNFAMGNDCPVCRGKISPSLFSMPIRYDLDIHMQCPEDYADECADMVDRDHFRKSYIKGQEPTKSKPTLRRSKRTTREKYYWIYESSSFGYYRYDPKDEKYLEECYCRKMETCVMRICGTAMLINIKDGVQEQVENEVRCTRRKILRIKATEIEKYNIKGIAGINSYCRPIRR
ncbi:RING-type domain-containing protein [Caenorhabditis elegans]|uniref:RING-type domain-containing protein n=1 Tax=Caenorhabditis elegans TaxID=6239 RepID=Q18199_CAEEL|nr:RING-type domain-containing protein [Caenorhabditis elegans]CCD65712.1 RING-type domain-containing protein [Caenorhabditis elegans]|eukprot:NP_508904.2 Uncharacterized protein CELE_C26B9.6 [Caenorhabditis elegans]